MPDKKISDLDEATITELDGDTCVPVSVESSSPGTYITKKTTIGELRGATSSAGGSHTQVQYNSNGALAGSQHLTYDGTNLTVQNLTLPAKEDDPSEGGQMYIKTAPGNSTAASNTIIIDMHNDTIRVFEAGGNYRGAKIDIAMCDGGVGSDLLKKAVVASSAPTFKNDGDLWFDDTTSSLHVYVESISGWVQT